MKGMSGYTRVVFALIFLLGVFLLPTPAFAQLPRLTPTPGSLITPTSQTPNLTPGTPGNPGTAERIANCDICGYCDGGKVPGRWENCKKCMYPAVGEAAASDRKTLIGVPTPDPYHYYTDLGCISTRPGEFANQIIKFFFSIIGGIAFLTFLYGTAVLATARGDIQQINHGRRIIWGSIVGLLFALFSIFIVDTLASGLGLPI